MAHVTLVTGQAGTGKTTWLMHRANEYAQGMITAEHQRMLAITRMHGARRRVEMKLQELCHNIPYDVATIDGFALSIVNRWRTASGYKKPIIAVPYNVEFLGTLFGVEAGFACILSEAARLLESPTVGKLIGTTYPLIMVDEFQDCYGPLLEFVKGLSRASNLLVAADDFQLLDSTVCGCPAIDWVEQLQAKGEATIEELTFFHRTSSKLILNTARCLRENIHSADPKIPIFCCPNHGVAAWKIIERLVLTSRADRWAGACALICPSHDPFLQKVIASCDDQLKKKNHSPIRWTEELTGEEERVRILTTLGITEESCGSNTEWCVPSGELDRLGMCIVDRAKRFCKLRGLKTIPIGILEKHADKIVHDLRAYSAQSPKRAVTTVHGAKNREFDNVIILWTYKLPPDSDQQRRWLYNAVTRSKENCMILVWGDENRVKCDPVLSLLGLPQPVFRGKRRGRHKTPVIQKG
jgi:hypothetical protein